MPTRSVPFLALAAALLVLLVSVRPLLPIDETRYLAVAWEMHLSGDAFHLTRNFAPYAHKPPLLFWLINMVWAVTGVSEGAARLVGPVCALGAIAGTGALARRIWPQDMTVSWRAMVVVASLPVFLVYGSATMFDALLTLAVLAGIAVLWRIGQGGATARVWVSLGLALGLGILAKGPVMLVHLAPVFLTMRAWATSAPTRVERLRGMGLALSVGLAVVLVWLLPALVTGDGAFLHELLWTQTAARVTGDLGHGRPVWFLLALAPLAVFPWGWSWRFWRTLPEAARTDRGVRLGLIWAVGGLALFSVIGGKQLHYLLPELPAFALVAARVLGPVWRRRGGSLAPVPLAVLGLGLAVLALSGKALTLGEGLSLAPVAVGALSAVLLVLTALGTVLPCGAAQAVMGMGLAVGLHLVLAAGGVWARLDTQPIADRVAAEIDNGVALFGMADNADFNFKARLTRPVETPETAEALADWRARHPSGWVMGPIGHSGLAAPPDVAFLYRGRPFGMWRAARPELDAIR